MNKSNENQLKLIKKIWLLTNNNNELTNQLINELIHESGSYVDGVV